MKSVYIAFIVLSVSACVTENNWGKSFATASCKVSASCSKASFSSYYDSVGECVDDAVENWEDNEDDYTRGCDFDKKYAQKCIAGMNKYAKTCNEDEANDLDKDCGKVWDCGGGGGVVFDTSQ